MPSTTSAIPFGVGVPQGWRMDLAEINDPIEKYEAMTRAAQEVERLGYDSIWLFDHFHTVPTPELETTFECFTSLAGLARDTQRVKLGQMATCNGYRNPAVLAKIGSTIDVMSHGRFILGFGAGWYEHEYRAYGFGFPDLSERMGRYREAAEIIHRMWAEDYPTFSGKYYTIDKPINEPKGAQKPHPPLWFAGGGERVTLKLVAQWGDGSNFGAWDDLDGLRRRMDTLRRHCDDFNRDFDSLSRSSSINYFIVENPANAERETAEAWAGSSFEMWSRGKLIGTAEQIANTMRKMVEIGVNYFIIYPPRLAYDYTQLQRFTREILPAFQR